MRACGFLSLPSVEFGSIEMRRMSVEFVDTPVVGYSLSDDAPKRRQALAIWVNQPVLSLQVPNAGCV